MTTFWSFFLDIIFPRFCFGCGKWGSYICNNCSRRKIDYYEFQICPYCHRHSLFGFTHPSCEIRHGLDGLFILAHYQKLIPKIVHEIKYQSIFAASKEVAELINDRYHQNFHFDYFVPVPLSKKRERERGFNQAEKLAKALKLRPVKDLLIRTRDTKPQFDLTPEMRQKNIQGAFALNPKLKATSLAGYSFCLVDDVITTGSTLFECAKVLKSNGAKKVFAITIARGG